MIKAVIDLFGILINQDFFISLVDVNKENDISVLASVSYPTPCALFALLARPESPSLYFQRPATQVNRYNPEYGKCNINTCILGRTYFVERSIQLIEEH